MASTAKPVSIGPLTATNHGVTLPRRRKLPSGRKGATKKNLSARQQLPLLPRQRLRHTGKLGAAAAQTIPLTPPCPCSYRMQRNASRLHSQQVVL